MNKSVLALLAAGLLSAGPLAAKENPGSGKTTTGARREMRTSAACVPSSSSVELDVNNVRCLLHNGGDMWWDLVGSARYEVPKVDNPADQRHSSFAASLWIGGIDESGQLRIAAQTYRQTGYDFWPGPLTSTGAATENATCKKWDKHFKITKSEIDAFRAAYQASISSGEPFNLSDYPNVQNWPAFGETSDGEVIALAPRVSVSGDAFGYHPEQGDYPNIAPCEGGGSPDQAIWWVINDKGNVHTETGGEAIGLEIQMLAFAFSTANAVNDMTFYKYKVINKSSFALNETFMGQWVDSDVGNAYDDYVGCDTTAGPNGSARMVGFAYNGDANDETAGGYGVRAPAFGMDFFQGPFGDDGVRLDMTNFMYYENDWSLRGNPEVATHFYGYMRNYWKDGSRTVNNGKNGHSSTGGGPETNFMYPGKAWCGAVEGWNEFSAGNQPYDRRFLQSAGPFTLQSGAVNDIVTGAVWARGDDYLASVCELLTADDIAQALFDACFQLLDGPDAPELSIAEYDKQLMLSWGYSPESRLIVNNYNESYEQDDPVLVSTGAADPTFTFQGYMLFQLKDNKVSASELFDTEKARLVAQCDIQDGIATIVNRSETSVGGLPVVVDEVMVTGDDLGTFYSVTVDEDLFAAGSDRTLKNYTNYYYGILAYAYNNETSDGRMFVQGNRFFKNTSAMPHKIDFENFGTVINSDYGDGMEISQTAGIGNGGNYIDITEECENSILSTGYNPTVTYKSGKAPITVKVVNPKNVTAHDYVVDVVGDQFEGTADTLQDDTLGMVIDSTFIEWILYEDGNVKYLSTYNKRTALDTTGLVTNVAFRPVPLSGIERVIDDRGISVTVRNTYDAWDTTDAAITPMLGADLEYNDPLKAWMTGVPNSDEFATWDWIRSGADDQDLLPPFGVLYDKKEFFEDVLGGTWAPFCMSRGFINGDQDAKISPGVQISFAAAVQNMRPEDFTTNVNSLPDVDIVFTSDTTKWSRCIVLETTPAQNLGSGAWPMSMRWERPINNPSTYQIEDSANITLYQGWSYFPGYAINVNTGERMNIFYGENSFDKLNNGDDMRWNPTDDFGPGGVSVGGRHYVYVHNSRYDKCASLAPILKIGNTVAKGGASQIWFNSTLDGTAPGSTSDTAYKFHRVYKDVAWVGMPMNNGNFPFDNPQNMPTDARVKLRIRRPFGSRTGTTDHPIFNFSTDNLAANVGVKEVAEKSLMEMIRIVPNPYYAYSRYEASQLQTLVKITNLPQKCKIRIYTLNGTLIKTFNKDSDIPEQIWDLKNDNAVPIASGVYIIHVDGFDLGETVLKFFSIMPQPDFNAF